MCVHVCAVCVHVYSVCVHVHTLPSLARGPAWVRVGPVSTPRSCGSEGRGAHQGRAQVWESGHDLPSERRSAESHLEARRPFRPVLPAGTCQPPPCSRPAPRLLGHQTPANTAAGHVSPQTPIHRGQTAPSREWGQRGLGRGLSQDPEPWPRVGGRGAPTGEPLGPGCLAPGQGSGWCHSFQTRRLKGKKHRPKATRTA